MFLIILKTFDLKVYTLKHKNSFKDKKIKKVFEMDDSLNNEERSSYKSSE